MVLMFGRSRHLQAGVVKLLSRCVIEYASQLRQVAGHNTKLHPHVYENMYYIFWCLQQLLQAHILGGGGGNGSLQQEVVVAMETELEDSLLHISQSFPLFTHFVWEIGALVQCLKQQ